MSASPRALVLGATGHLGQAVLRALLDAGHAVTAAARRPSRALDDITRPFDLCLGDAEREGQLSAWARGHQVIVDAAAPYPLHLFVDAGREAFARARRRTERLVDAARENDALLVFISTFTTLPRPHERGIEAVEARWRRQIHPYFAVKSMMESIVLDACARGLRALVVNPASCVGPWESKDAALSLVGSVLSGTFAITVRDQIVNVLDVRDLAACVLAAMARGPFGVALPLAGHDVRFDELTARIALAAGVRPPAFRVTPRFGTLASLWIESG